MSVELPKTGDGALPHDVAANLPKDPEDELPKTGNGALPTDKAAALPKASNSKVKTHIVKTTHRHSFLARGGFKLPKGHRLPNSGHALFKPPSKYEEVAEVDEESEDSKEKAEPTEAEKKADDELKEVGERALKRYNDDTDEASQIADEAEERVKKYVTGRMIPVETPAKRQQQRDARGRFISGYVSTPEDKRPSLAAEFAAELRDLEVKTAMPLPSDPTTTLLHSLFPSPE